MRRDMSGSLVIVVPTRHSAVTLAMTFCAVAMDSVGVACACVRTTPYEVAPTANCVR